MRAFAITFFISMTFMIAACSPTTTKPIVRPKPQGSEPAAETKPGSQRSSNQQAAEPDSELQLQALAILEAKCASCHSLNNAQGGFGTVLNVDEMIKTGLYIIPGQANDSEIVKRLAPAGNMPPNGDISESETQTLSTWINEMQVKEVVPLTDRQQVQMIRQDVESNVNIADRISTRYFSLQISNNSGFSEQTRDFMIKAFLKTLNSLSRASTIYKPQAIDESGLLYRVNLRNLLVDAALFDQIIADFYPFSRNFENFGNDPQAAALAADDDFLSTSLGTTNYVLRMDWFNATATLPVIYSQLLGLPETQQELEAQLGVNRLTDIQNNQVMRAGFRNSGVSSQNRMIERIVSSTTNLPFWISYDFADNNEDQQNLFNFPLGPVGAGFDNIAFNQDGGEIIFQLPNGMFGYYLSLANGGAIHKGPTNIVKQDNGPTQFFQQILNGLSCMSCHGQGLLFKKDEIREFATISQDFSQLEKDKIFNLYPNADDIKTMMDQDNQAYFAALSQMGIERGEQDPVDLSYRYYNRNLYREDVRAELGISTAVLDVLLSQEPFKSRWVSIYTNSGSITRQEFNQLFTLAINQIATGALSTVPVLGDHLATPACMTSDLARMEGCTELPVLQ